MTQTPPPPPPEAELFPPLLKCVAVIAAGQLGLFQTLAEGPRTPAELASATGGSARALVHLAEALVALGYLERAGDGYANGPAARTWLTSEGVADYTPLLLFLGETWGYFGGLAETVRRGTPDPTLYELMAERPEVGRLFSRYMRANALLQASAIAEAAPLPISARRLLDLGGSHGLHSIAYCRRNPELSAVIVDLPSALAETEEVVAREGLSDRISVRRGDFLRDELGGGYDAILCFGVVDALAEEQNERLFARVAEGLDPGGVVITHSHLRTEPADPFNALFSLIMFMSWGAQTYSYEEITGWLARAGMGDFTRTDLRPGMSSLVRAVKQR